MFYHWSRRSIGLKRPGGARGTKAFRPERSATLIENRGALDRDPRFLRSYRHRRLGSPFLTRILERRTHCRSRSYKGDDCTINGSRLQISAENILAPIRKSRRLCRSFPYLARSSYNWKCDAALTDLNFITEQSQFRIKI